MAAFLFGLPSGGGIDRKASFAEQSTVWSMYVQHDFKVTSRLRLNLGLRWEVEGPTTERFNRSVRGYDFQTLSPLNDQVRANYAKNPIPEIPVDHIVASHSLCVPTSAVEPLTRSVLIGLRLSR